VNQKDFKIVPNGDAALTILFQRPISEQLSTEIFQLVAQIKLNAGHHFEEIIPAYQSLTLCFNPLMHERQQLVEQLEALLQSNLPPPKTQPALIKIPVCYEAEYGPDQNTVTTHCNLNVADMIRKHTAQPYLVHMLGFTPGFLYLGGLDSALHCPRKSTPSMRVCEGSVGIGGNQTGIYPHATPGGWQIIGRTPITMFDPKKDSPFVARPLDKVQFYPINKAEFNAMRAIG